MGSFVDLKSVARMAFQGRSGLRPGTRTASRFDSEPVGPIPSDTAGDTQGRVCRWTLDKPLIWFVIRCSWR